MNLINIENITKYYTDTPLFEQASFTVDESEKIGIIGINGTGKTTLLKMLVGMEEPDSGTVTRANNIVVRYLPQTPDFQRDITVLEAVMEGNRTHENEWSLESDAKTMLQKLGISDYGMKVDTMSGGQRKRVALASTLLSKADILVLDEPTNHLDSAMADWLEEYLKSYRGALVMVTHDRYFLDSVSNRIVEIDKAKIQLSDELHWISGVEGAARGHGVCHRAQAAEHSARGNRVDETRRARQKHETKSTYPAL